MIKLMDELISLEHFCNFFNETCCFSWLRRCCRCLQSVSPVVARTTLIVMTSSLILHKTPDTGNLIQIEHKKEKQTEPKNSESIVR